MLDKKIERLETIIAHDVKKENLGYVSSQNIVDLIEVHHAHADK